MNKLSSIKKNRIVVRMIILSSLMIETLDDLEVLSDSPLAKETKKLIEYLEDIVDQAYKNDVAKTTTHLNMLIHKVDTVIRKNNK